MDAPDMSEDQVKEWLEAYQEMMKSRKWSDATLSKSELDTIESKVNLEKKQVLMGTAARALKTKYSALAKKTWCSVGGVDNGPIGSA